MQKLGVYTAHTLQTKKKDENIIKNLLHRSNIKQSKPELVQTLIFHAAFRCRCYNEQTAGESFAKTMPNIKVLNMNTTANYIYGAISTYASLGSRLTERTLDASHIPLASKHPNDEPPKDFCDIITNYL